MAYTTINKSTAHFNTVTWSGDSTTPKNITGVGFTPDLIWGKSRNTAYNHKLYDSVRTFGNDKELSSSENTVEGGSNSNQYGYLSGTVSDGFTTTKGSDGGADGYGYWNESGRTYVAWNWKAGTTGSGNTGGSGTYKAYSYSVNTTAGFSIVKYKGNGTAGHTIPHHLGAVPKMYVVKKISGTGDWYTYHVGSGATTFLKLNGSDAKLTNSLWNNTAPTNSVFNIDNNSAVNGNDEDYIAYVFAEKTGYSKIGSFTGTGNADGAFVYTGFKPTFLIFKNAGVGSESWEMFDTKRDNINVSYKGMHPNTSGAELTNTAQGLDILSNGFKARANENRFNDDQNTIIYMAFGQSLVGSNNVPCTAR